MAPEGARRDRDPAVRQRECRGPTGGAGRIGPRRRNVRSQRPRPRVPRESAGVRALLLLWIGCSAKTDPLPLIPEPTPPRLIAPLSGSWIGSQPLLRWESEGEVTVQLCRDRSCSDVLFEKKLEAE